MVFGLTVAFPQKSIVEDLIDVIAMKAYDDQDFIGNGIIPQHFLQEETSFRLANFQWVRVHWLN